MWEYGEKLLDVTASIRELFGAPLLDSSRLLRRFLQRLWRSRSPGAYPRLYIKVSGVPRVESVSYT